MNNIDHTDLAPAARWTPDVNGKQDYDGELLSISTRYWPAWKSADNKPSANASILIRHIAPGDIGFAEHGESDYTVWREADFAADTEAEVKVQVEAWVGEQFRAVLGLLVPVQHKEAS